jgi:23S rRNA (adenine2503-C2)-methyltransferase
MGMGEPLLNLDNVLKAIDILNNPKYFGIAARSISISTVGIPEGIKKIGNYKKQINLAWSLHAPNDKLRQQLMPIGKKYKIDKVMSVLDHYYEKTKRQIMVEYLLIKGVNDSEKHALELASLLSGHNFFLNLIRYNATGHFLPSDSLAIENFKKILKKEKINFGQRHSFGGQISAACGQLAGKK